jgi:hypothetical protein
LAAIGVVALLVGLVLWLAGMAMLGWSVMAISALLAISGLVLGAVWNL